MHEFRYCGLVGGRLEYDFTICHGDDPRIMNYDSYEYVVKERRGMSYGFSYIYHSLGVYK